MAFTVKMCFELTIMASTNDFEARSSFQGMETWFKRQLRRIIHSQQSFETQMFAAKTFITHMHTYVP